MQITIGERSTYVKKGQGLPIHVSLESGDAPPSPELLENCRVLGRPQIDGKFFLCDGQRFHVKGVTYGPFQGKSHYPTPATVDHDFARMAAEGFNTVRVFYPPPRWVLDTAAEHGLRILVGLAWEQHVAFLSDRALCRQIKQRISTYVNEVHGHPAIFAYVLGNEIPSPMVRWFGAKHVARFVHDLFKLVKSLDVDALVTYANFPTTQYLSLPFLDFVSFNIYLHDTRDFSDYLMCLQHEADERPLVLSEIGFDSKAHGDASQADALAAQVSAAFVQGCAGVFVFSWTDEWFTGGANIDKWQFGLTRSDRTPKPSLAAVSGCLHSAPFPADTAWPRMSVIVCTYNGSRTLCQCLDTLSKLDYPNYEVIVVDDGSTDQSAAIAGNFDVRLISQSNQGLSAARNAGLAAATGEIVAYTDDDAYADSLWLKHLAIRFMRSNHAGIGGPNLPCPNDGCVADCVAHSPGGPTHVMLTEQIAEHIPGCNMAFRTDILRAIGGFDAEFRIAGDDVDICWRLQERGHTLGFSPAAVVWHHRRKTVRTYLRQQLNYGKAEAMLERKWPTKYNTLGHPTWTGRLYQRGPEHPNVADQRVFYGKWGTGAYQTAHPVSPSFLTMLPMMPEWYLGMAVLGLLSLGSLAWPPLLFVLPLFAMMLLISAVVIVGGALPHFRFARSEQKHRGFGYAFRCAALIGFFHTAQPIVRLWGRFSGGLTPWRSRDDHATVKVGDTASLPRRAVRKILPHQFPQVHLLNFWSESWREHPARLADIDQEMRKRRIAVRSGESFDRWDFEVRSGAFGGARVWSTVEEHGNDRQMTRIRVEPRWKAIAQFMQLALLIFAAVAACDAPHHHAALLVAAACGALFLLVTVRCLRDISRAMSQVLASLAAVPSLGTLVIASTRRDKPGSDSKTASPPSPPKGQSGKDFPIADMDLPLPSVE